MAAKTNTKPRLKNLDDLFKLNDGVNPLEQTVSMIETQPAHKRVIAIMPVDKLKPFDGHPFHLYEGDRLNDMVESIRANGVLVPIIVRCIDAVFEILAGHNRVNAAKMAGLNEVPAILLEKVSDEDAIMYVVETNLIQRSFADMTHSEKAAVIALHHSKMFSQGKRNDIIEQLKMLENPHGNRENERSPQVGAKLRTDEKVGNTYSLSKNTVARYLRISKLIPALKTRLDSGGIAFLSAVTISFLKEGEQSILEKCIEKHGLSVDMKKAEVLRQYSEKGKLNGDSAYQILSGETVKKPNRTPTVKINKAAYAKYFKPNQSAKDIQGIVEKALEMYFSQA